jgi:hypothetical protein
VSIGDIMASPHFDPRPVIAAFKPELLRCYDEARTLTPDLHGKLILVVRVNEAGAVLSTEAQPGGQANDPGLVGCIVDAMKPLTFPKPGGSAAIAVPLVFRRQ